jgi:hypothetical protein
MGTVLVMADTTTDIDNRTVLLSNPKIKELSFPDADEATLATMRKNASSVLKTVTKTISLDRMLAAAVELDVPVKGVAVKYDPPVIFYTEKPAILLITDGDPVLSPIKGTELMYVVNTNWDLFYEQATTTYYLRNEKTWLTATALAGPWKPAGKLPADLSKLPDDDNWKDVKGSLPGTLITASQMPQVFSSAQPAEMLLINGTPQFTPITGVNGLLYVSNTDSDIFLYGSDAVYYLLIAGRWFQSADLAKGQWTAVGSSLPKEFANIPPDSPKGRVLASVPGTDEAKEAAIMAQLPQTATVKVSEAKLDVVYDGDPKFEPITGTSMQYATNSPYDVIRVGDMYYCCFQAVWFVSASAKGPWVVTGDVPSTVYTIPPSSPVHTVTYVTVVEEESNDDEVAFSFVAGLLLGMIIADDGCCVYGTGWYYPPYIYHGGYYPIYYPHPPTWGCGAYYNPHYGIYQSGARYYGPYGGAGWGAAYNPHTGTYARGAAAYGPYRAGAAGAAYNPYTGAYARGAAVSGPGGSAAYARGYNPSTGVGAAGYQRSNGYASWGQAAVSNGDNWAKGGYYEDSRGSVSGVRTSEGTGGAKWDTDNGSGFAVRGENNTYAGKDGNVYKKTDDGWQKYNDGSWNSVEGSGGKGAAAGASQTAASGKAGTATMDANISSQLNREAQVRSTGQQRTNAHQSSQQRASTSSANRSSSNRQSSSRGGGGGRRR